MSKFKAGDKIQCTGCIDQIDQDGDAYVRFPGGNSKNLTVILAKELERAKLIEPAPEEKLLDLNKPMRVRFGSEVCRYLATDNLTGDVYVQFVKDGSVFHFTTMELENVPEEKRKVRGLFYLTEKSSVPINPLFYDISVHGRILGQKVLEIAEGDGMEDEQ